MTGIGAIHRRRRADATGEKVGHHRGAPGRRVEQCADREGKRHDERQHHDQRHHRDGKPAPATGQPFQLQQRRPGRDDDRGRPDQSAQERQQRQETSASSVPIPGRTVRLA